MKVSRYFWHVAVAASALLMLAPIVWMFSTSLKPEGEVLSAVPRWIPETPTLENYRELANRSAEFPVGRWLMNSLGIALTVTLLVLLVTSMAAFAFSRLRFRGRDRLFMLAVATLMIPAQVSLIPVFLIVQKLGWFNTYPGLIVPALASTFGVFLLRQFFITIPAEYEEAATLDGANVATIFWRVILPLGKPALATLGIFTFLGSWNDFVWPLIISNDIEMRTLPVGLTIFQGRFTTEYGITMAAAVMATVPVVIAYLFFRRRITAGISLGGLKG